MALPAGRRHRVASAVGVLLIVAVAGCGNDDAAEPPTESPATPPPAPATGECYDAGKDAFSRHLDGSEPVDCSQPHTLETAKVIVTDEPITPDNVSEHAGACRQAFTEYVGGPPASSRLQVHFIVADEQTQAAGSHWLRCDIMAAVDTGGSKPESRTGSDKGALSDGTPHELRACLNAPPNPETKQRYVPCDEPHVAELVPEGVTLGTAGESYPGPEALETRAEQACTELIAATGYPDHIGTNWAYPSEQNWATGDRAGGCWVTATLPPIGTTPTPAGDGKAQS